MIYQNLKLMICEPFFDVVTYSRKIISNDIESFGSTTDQNMLYWFTDEKWSKNKFTNTVVICNEYNEIVALCGNKMLDDNTVKILCHFYVLKKFRNLYQGIHQVLIIPKMVEHFTNVGAYGLWYSFDPYDKRHKRYSESQKRLLKGANVSTDLMPYWDKFKFVGQVNYNNTVQDKFYMELRGSTIV